MRATGIALAIAFGFASVFTAPAPSWAEAGAAEPEWRHASSLSEAPGYPADFEHFAYVNPDAPKGGRLRLASPSGFDSFNPVLRRANPAPGIGLIYDTLMTPAFDEEPISAQYGLIAEAVRYPDDFAWVEYRIHPDAKWHDGTAITVEDVVWSLDALKEANPLYAYYYGDVTEAVAVDDRTVRFNFARPGNRELPHIVGQLLVLPKAWWTATAADGTERSLASGTLEPPLGSGAYEIADFVPGRSVTYERVDDYWAADHPTQIGTNNFDEIAYEIFRDETVVLEAFKADRYDFRIENSAKNWATQYDFEAVREGDVILETFPDEARGIMQAFVVNLRLPKFQDERVRRALNLLYDFEAQKDSIFYGQYERIDSYFEGTELASSGLPEGRELEILEEVRDLVPASVFSEPYQNPVGGDAQKARANAREAVKLFQEAGYKLDGRALVDAQTGERFSIEITLASPTMERVALPYAQALERVGIDVKVRSIDDAQYTNRVNNRDFEMIVGSWAQSLSPGNEQREYWGSEAAGRPESRNLAGIKDPGIDALIERVILASDREDLVAATRALDRVLLHNNFVVPQYYASTTRTARWNRFGHPDNIPPYTTGFPTIWWYDQEKAASVGSPS